MIVSYFLEYESGPSYRRGYLSFTAESDDAAIASAKEQLRERAPRNARLLYVRRGDGEPV
jgi:hypothetical protein